MGKDKVENVETTQDDSIIESIRSGAMANENLAKAASEEIQSIKDNKKKREIMRLKLQTDYDVSEAVLRLRKERAHEKAQKKYVNELGKLSERAQIGDNLTMHEFEEAKQKIAGECRDAKREADQEYQKMERELREQSVDLKWEF